MRSRAVFLPRACCFSTARSEPGVGDLGDAALEVGELAGGGGEVEPGTLGDARCPGAAMLVGALRPCRTLALWTCAISLDIETLSEALVTSGRPWRGVEFHPALGRPKLREAASAGATPWPVVVLTDHQQAGRGRLGRAWTVPPGASLAVSRCPHRRTRPGGCRCSPGWPWPCARSRSRPGGRSRLGSSGPTTCSSPTTATASSAASSASCQSGGRAVVVGTGINVDQTRERAAGGDGHVTGARGVPGAPRGPPAGLPRPPRAPARRPPPGGAAPRGAGRHTAPRAPPSVCGPGPPPQRCRRAGPAVAVDDEGGLVVRTARASMPLRPVTSSTSDPRCPEGVGPARAGGGDTA